MNRLNGEIKACYDCRVCVFMCVFLWIGVTGQVATAKSQLHFLGTGEMCVRVCVCVKETAACQSRKRKKQECVYKCVFVCV